MRRVSKLFLETPKYFRLSLCATSHGWVNLSPFYYSSIDFTLHRTEQIGNSTYVLSIKQDKSILQVNILPKICLTHCRILEERIRRALSFDFSINDFIKYSSKLSKEINSAVLKGYSYFLRSFTPFEDAVKTLITTNCSWGYTKNISHSLCLHLGKKAFDDTYSFPSLKRLKDLTEIDFRRLGLGYRSNYLVSLCHNFLLSKSTPQNWLGFGNYASAHFSFLCGSFEQVPVDREVCRYLKIPYNSQSFVKVNSLYSDWGPYKFLAYKIERRLRKENWIGF